MEIAAKLVEIKAGLTSLVDNRLVSDPRKGKVEVIRDQDGLVHFTWSERRDTQPPEIDIVLFPGNGTFSKLPGRRMFLLSHNSDEKLFFWAQEPDKGQDEQQCITVNECINSFTADVDADDDGEDEAEEDMEDAEPAAALQADATAGAEATQQPEPALPEVTRPSQGIQAGDLARVLGSLGVPQASTAQPQRPSAPSGPTTAGSIDALALAAALAGAADSSSGAGSAQQHMQRAPGPSLAEVLTPEVLIPLVSEPGVLERLSAHLPEEHRTRAGLVELAASAQLRHQLSLLSLALQTAQLDPSQFGLTPTGYTVVEFLESVQKKVDSERKADQQDMQ